VVLTPETRSDFFWLLGTLSPCVSMSWRSSLPVSERRCASVVSDRVRCQRTARACARTVSLHGGRPGRCRRIAWCGCGRTRPDLAS
jgi:hypothetical protein